MVQLATREIPGFVVKDFELQRTGPSYTIDTVREILKSTQNVALLLGQDAIGSLHLWKEIEELVTLLPLYIGYRSPLRLDPPPPLAPKIQEAVQKGLIETPLMDISATEVRRRIKESLYCKHLVPEEVLDYIYENQLYSILKR